MKENDKEKDGGAVAAPTGVISWPIVKLVEHSLGIDFLLPSKKTNVNVEWFLQVLAKTVAYAGFGPKITQFIKDYQKHQDAAIPTRLVDRIERLGEVVQELEPSSASLRK